MCNLVPTLTIISCSVLEGTSTRGRRTVTQFRADLERLRACHRAARGIGTEGTEPRNKAKAREEKGTASDLQTRIALLSV